MALTTAPEDDGRVRRLLVLCVVVVGLGAVATYKQF